MSRSAHTRDGLVPSLATWNCKMDVTLRSYGDNHLLLFRLTREPLMFARATIVTVAPLFTRRQLTSPLTFYGDGWR